MKILIFLFKNLNDQNFLFFDLKIKRTETLHFFVKI